MTKHPTRIEAYDGSMEELAREVASLRYDALGDFLLALSRGLHEDSRADIERHRPRLGSALWRSSVGLASAYLAITEAWEICEPHEKTEP